MKLTIFLMAVVLSSTTIQAQNDSFCVVLEKEPEFRKVIAKFDSLYTPLSNIKLPDSVSIGKAWGLSFRPAFLEYLKNANLEWDDTTGVWIDLCCSSSGKIERVLYKTGGLSNPIRELKFNETVESFAKGYSFPITTAKTFNQCGSFRFLPNKKK
jgi:hypothetical protein